MDQVEKNILAKKGFQVIQNEVTQLIDSLEGSYNHDMSPVLDPEYCAVKGILRFDFRRMTAGEIREVIAYMGLRPFKVGNVLTKMRKNLDVIYFEDSSSWVWVTDR